MVTSIFVGIKSYDFISTYKHQRYGYSWYIVLFCKYRVYYGFIHLRINPQGYNAVPQKISTTPTAQALRFTRLAETLLVRADFLRHQLTKASSLKQEVGRQWFFSLENGGYLGFHGGLMGI